MRVEVLSEHVISDRRLGRHVHHDPRSRDYPARLPREVALEKVRHRHHGHVLDQGDVGSCTGQAAAQAMNTDPLHVEGARLLTEDAALELYSLATTLDPYPGSWPPDDTGSSGLAVAKALQQRGLIREYRWAFGIDEALAALQAAPVITGVPWLEGMDSPDDRGFVEATGQVRGGHEFVVHSYHPQPAGHPAGDAYVEAINSWGPGWGEHGKFRFNVATWALLLSMEGDVTVLVP